MSYNYSTKTTENSAKAAGIALPISTKYSVETLNMIRGKPVEKAKQLLEAVIAKKRAVALKRYYEEVPHKKGMAAGKYPIKCCTHILKMVKSAEANAQFKGLNTSDLIIKHASAQQGSKTHRYGRHRGRTAKRTHIEIVLEEKIQTKKRTTYKKKKIQKTNKEAKAENKTETKTQPKTETKKPEDKK